MTMCTACSHEESARHKPVPKTPKAKAKVSKVMGEFKSGDLKSSSGENVANPKQATIALSEARRAGRKK